MPSHSSDSSLSDMRIIRSHCASHSHRHDSLSAHRCSGAVLPVEPGGMSTASATRQRTASWQGAESEPKGPTVLPSR